MAPLSPSQESPIRGRRVAVFGAGGFIGARLVEKLVHEHGAIVSPVFRRRRGHSAPPSTTPVIANLRNARDVVSAVADCEIVLNLAHDFRASEKENLACFDHLVDACVRARVGRFIHTSSIAVYDDWPRGDLTEESPRERRGSEYKNAKLAMERALADLADGGSLRSVILQPTIVYGPRSWLWTDHVAERLLTGTLLVPDNGKGLCNAVYVDDVADALILAATVANPTYESFIISAAEPTSWSAYFEAIASALGQDSIRYVDSAELRGKAPDTPPSPSASRRLVRAVIHRALELAGPALVDRLKTTILARRKKHPVAVHSPDPHEVELYLFQGRCHIDKARTRLGYDPKFDYTDGSRRTSKYLSEKFGRPGPKRAG